jgi:hypothetical protein
MSGRVPPSQRAKISDVFARFTGRDPVAIAKIRAPATPAVAGVIGYCDAIEYTTERDGKVERYRHRFAKADRPYLVVYPDMTVQILGGSYRFTELGIVDDSDQKHAQAR